MINTVVFDIGMVLVYFRWRELFADLGFEGEKFEDAYAVEIPEGYWVYAYSTMVNFYEFRWFKTLEKAQAYYDGQKFEEDSLLFDKAILYIDNDRKDCILLEVCETQKLISAERYSCRMRIR